MKTKRRGPNYNIDDKEIGNNLDTQNDRDAQMAIAMELEPEICLDQEDEEDRKK